MIVDVKKKPKTKNIVLKPQAKNDTVNDVIEKNKTKLFRHLLKTPKSDEVHVHSLSMIYEPLMILSGTYNADFLRKATHELSVEHNVKEIVFGDGIFPSSNFTLSNKLVTKMRKNTVKVELEEHVFVANGKEIVLDNHGELRDFTYKVDTKDVENYPNAVLKKNTVREFEMTEETAIKKLVKLLQSHDTFEEVRDLNESLIVDDITKIYVPIFEARLVGPKKKVKILRYDAVKKKLV
ncbi:MAG: hypothetical protein KC483_10045 [Nitrosarchaeum sp.]|nr:hypothetical protein [Nitrosarchaeum sp.]